MDPKPVLSTTVRLRFIQTAELFLHPLNVGMRFLYLFMGVCLYRPKGTNRVT
jgi:hypothetical protein